MITHSIKAKKILNGKSCWLKKNSKIFNEFSDFANISKHDMDTKNRRKQTNKAKISLVSLM